MLRGIQLDFVGGIGLNLWYGGAGKNAVEIRSSFYDPAIIDSHQFCEEDFSKEPVVNMVWIFTFVFGQLT